MTPSYERLGVPDMMRLSRWRGMAKVCSLYRRWRWWAEPGAVMLSSAEWISPFLIRREIAAL